MLRTRRLSEPLDDDDIENGVWEEDWMTLLAGIFSRAPDLLVPESACDALKRAISRRREDQISVFRDPRACLIKLDVGAFGQPAYRIDPSGTVTMLAGEPLLRGNDGRDRGGRASDLEFLHQSWDQEDWNLLGRTQGVFCAVHYCPDSSTLTLIADKLGLRPLYYWVGESFLIFAGALRILEALLDVPKTMDLRAITEIVGFGYPLGSRTPYHDVSALRAAEITRITGGELFSRRYWRWDGIAVSDRSESELLKSVNESFMAAVERRLGEDKTTVALLSGGLDSRCVVAALRARQARVHTINCSVPGSQDQVFGAEFAREIGTFHHEVEVGTRHPELFKIIREVWDASESRQKWPTERPLLIWTGNDGSVSLGHLWLTPEVVSLLRAGNLDAAVDHFLRARQQSVLSRLLHPRIARTLSGVLHAGLREELNDLHSQDPGRDLYLVVMVNNMRKHFRAYVENVDLYRLELQMPFLESDFLESVIAIPLDLCLRHRFYVKWLALFDRVVASVPWQAYPGHVPCPLPIPQGLVDQENAPGFRSLRAFEKGESLRRSAEVLYGDGFPDPILDKPYLRLVRFFHRLGLRDYGYALDAAVVYHHYWKVCSGSYWLPASSGDGGIHSRV